MALTKPQGDMVMKLGTEQASTSGTAIDFTGIPAGTTQIVLMLEAVSTNGVSNLLFQLGDAGGIENTGYISSCSTLVPTVTTATSTVGFIMPFAAATWNVHGPYIFILKDSTNFTWVGKGNFCEDGSADGMVSAGSKSLSAVLTQLRITSVSADTFDAGSINITYF